MAVHRGGSGLPMPVAERSLRASCPPLTRCFLRFAILASRKKQRRLLGTGSPSLPPVAQVFNLCVFHDSHAIPEGEAAGRRHAQKSVRRVPHGVLTAVAPELLRRKLTSPAGAEHVSGRLRCRDDERGSSVIRMPSNKLRPAGLEPATLGLEIGLSASVRFRSRRVSRAPRWSRIVDQRRDS